MIARSAVRQIPRGVIVGTKYGYRGTRKTIHSASKKAVKLHQKGSRWRWLVPTVIFIPLLYMTTSQMENKQEKDKPAKAWQVTAYSTLPLKALSRAWGRFNDVDLPIWLRAPGFKLYAWIFGANLDEIADPELTHYRNLGEFFYRELKPGARPIADSLLVSPCDGKVLQIGQLVGDRIEQVKGVSYSLESFIGIPSSAPHLHRRATATFDKAEDGLNRDQEFARLNGIPYTVDDIVGEGDDATYKLGDAADVSEQSKLGMAKMRDYFLPDFSNQENKRLCFAVIYLAPGDYHRFHSPTAWVAQLRRHFVGDLFSVAPYFQKKLADLFCLNERVAILGRWRHGFFSMIPVGATNVGNIQINFDKFLKTNSVYVKEQAEGELVRANKKNCYEATYASASPLLKGVPLSKGEEMGGFHLGSTVVLIFEAPETFKFEVSAGDVVKVGQRLGN